MRQTHMVLGVLVLVAAAGRVVLRLRCGVPPIPGLTLPLKLAKTAVELGMYFTMLVQPVLGVVYVQAGGKVVKLFGLSLPTLVQEQADLYHALGEWHSLMGYGFLALLALHICGALWHHFYLKDQVLSAMLFQPDVKKQN